MSSTSLFSMPTLISTTRQRKDHAQAQAAEKARFGLVCNETKCGDSHDITEPADAQILFICPKMWSAAGRRELDSAFDKSFPIENILQKLDSELLIEHTRHATIYISSFHLMTFTRRITRKLKVFKHLQHLTINIVPVHFNRYRKENSTDRRYILDGTGENMASRDLPTKSIALDSLGYPIEQLPLLETYEIIIAVDREARKRESQKYQDLVQEYADVLYSTIMKYIDTKYKLVRTHDLEKHYSVTYHLPAETSMAEDKGKGGLRKRDEVAKATGRSTVDAITMDMGTWEIV